jgi:hypothetical protein
MDRSVTVEVQWALYGKTADREDYHVLACSARELSRANFAEVIGRFSPGTPETLPQVTVSYVPTSQPGGNYLALAIHNYLESGREGSADNLGRPVAFTSYFCVPYLPLAEAAVGYRDLYIALRSLRLPPRNDSPLSVTVTPSPPLAPAVDPMTTQVAALLLMGRPVCVLGAQETTMTERLAFVDSVMALLPYGFRAKMTAATWTRATHRNHRFRLFFSGARRDTEQPDQVVYWGRPEETALTQDHDHSYWYQGWLSTEPVGRVLPLLCDLKQPRSLASKGDVLEALDAISLPPPAARGTRLIRPRTLESAPETTAPTENAEEAPGEPGREQFLLDCARYMNELNPRELNSTVSALRKMAKAGVTPAERARYREIVQQHRLFRHDEALGKSAAMLHEVLLRIAFSAPLSYEDYCLIEDGTGNDIPDPGLLQAIEKAGLADNRVKAITYMQLPRAEAEKRLSAWYASKEVSAPELFNLLALEVKRPQHTRLLCDVTIDYLRKTPEQGKPKEIDRSLRQHSYLTGKLGSSLAGQDQYQVNALGWFLSAAYPDGLTRSDIYHVMIGTKEPPTMAFLVAVLLMLADPADAALARELHMFSSVMSMSLEAATQRELERLVLPRIMTPLSPQPQDDTVPPPWSRAPGSGS